MIMERFWGAKITTGHKYKKIELLNTLNIAAREANKFEDACCCVEKKLILVVSSL
jgi:hypothetical protein